VDRATYPHIWQVRDELAGVCDDDIFERILSFVISGLCAEAPAPCRCGAHADLPPSRVLPYQDAV